jgi:hypothetical protein
MALLAIVAGCTDASDIQTDSTTGGGESNALQQWNDLVVAENAYTYSDLSISPDGIYALMAAPHLRLYKFENQWIEASTAEFSVPDNYPDYSEFDWDITIQSELVTDDSALDFVVRYDPAPWHVLEVPNQGRSWGTVVSGHGGRWRSLEFTDPYGDGAPYRSIEYIEYVNGALLGQWFGSCGRPCGLLAYTWVGGSQQLSGTEATETQANQLAGLYCADFSFAGSLPIKRCTEGQAVEYVQQILTDMGYELEVDGYYGRGTEFAVKYFQRQNSIRATGLVDLETWKALLDGMALPGIDLDGNGVITPEEFPGL